MLLQSLGWREKSSHQRTGQQGRVVESSVPVTVPPPKHDTYGIGFEPFKEAPEFELARQKKAQMAAFSAAEGNNVYRMSDVASKGDRPQRKSAPGSGSTALVLHKERMAGVQGFSLYDGDDDVYDNDVASGAYTNQLLYAPEDLDASDDDDDINISSRGPSGAAAKVHARASGNANALGSSFGSKLESYVESSTLSSKYASTTADGKKVLRNFLLLKLSDSQSDDADKACAFQKRWPGPRVPLSFEEGHKFGQNEFGRQEFQEKALQRQVAEVTSTSRADAFNKVKSLMSDRFTTASTEDSTKSDGTSQKIMDSFESSAHPSMRRITAKVSPWLPPPLLCKRLNIKVSKEGRAKYSQQESSGREGTSESFFATLDGMVEEKRTEGSQIGGGRSGEEEERRGSRGGSPVASADNLSANAIQGAAGAERRREGSPAEKVALTSTESRPSIHIFKSIFEDTDDDDDDDDDESDEDNLEIEHGKSEDDLGGGVRCNTESHPRETIKPECQEQAGGAGKHFGARNERLDKLLSEELSATSESDSSSSGSKKKKKKKRKKEKKKKKKKERKREKKKERERRKEKEKEKQTAEIA